MDPRNTNVYIADPSDAQGIFELNQQFASKIPNISDFRWGTLPWVNEEIDKEHYYVVRDSKGVAAALSLHTDTKDLCREYPAGTTGVLDAIAIRRELQNSGLSRQLRTWVEKKCRSEGITTLVGESFTGYGLEKLYTRWGFKREAEPANYKGHDYYLYSKDISSPAQQQARANDEKAPPSR